MSRQHLWKENGQKKFLGTIQKTIYRSETTGQDIIHQIKETNQAPKQLASVPSCPSTMTTPCRRCIQWIVMDFAWHNRAEQSMMVTEKSVWQRQRRPSIDWCSVRYLSLSCSCCKFPPQHCKDAPANQGALVPKRVPNISKVSRNQC